MAFWNWQQGRQGSGYSKFTLLFSKRLKFDAYILRLPIGTLVPHHRDPSPIKGYEHHRLNITLRSAKSGGITYVEAFRDMWTNIPIFEDPGRVYHFRPDLQEHFVTSILKGEVWLLSIGWLRKAR